MTNYLFFLDIDGTLLRKGSPIHQEVIDAAKLFRQGGGDIVLSTGRSPISTKWIAEKLDITLPAILFGGASLYDFSEDRHLVVRAVQNNILESVASVMDYSPKISVQVYTTEKIFLLQNTELLGKSGVKEEYSASIESTLDDVYGDILKTTLSCEDPQILQSCADAVFEGSDYHFAFAGRRFAEVVAKDVNKSEMIKELLSRLNIPISHTFAAGDAMTDYQMMVDCAYAFAPIDSNPKILEICDETIPVCEEGGVAIALHRALAALDKSSENVKFLQQ